MNGTHFNKIIQGEHLDRVEMGELMEAMLSGRMRPVETAAALTGLRLNGETIEEIVAAAETLRQRMGWGNAVSTDRPLVCLDRDEINVDQETMTQACSLHGGTQTFNISTAAALTAAAAGVGVAKFGSLTESNFCGSGDVVSALGVNLELTATESERCLDQIGLCFLYAPLFQGPLSHALSVRRELGLRTIFNLIGPLASPVRAEAQVLGVYSPDQCPPMAHVLDRLGVGSAYVVCGSDTLDEFSITGPSRVSHLKNGYIKTFDLRPEDLGLKPAAVADISGGDEKDNARCVREVLDGVPGPRRDVVLLNAAAALHAAGLAADLPTGLKAAAEAIDSGAALAKLEELIIFTAGCGVYQHKELG